MNWIDLAIFVLIIIFAWIGSKIGILTVVSSIFSGIIAYIVACLFYVKFAAFFPPKPSSLIISYFVIFFSVSVVIFYAGFAVSKLLRFMFVGLIDRFLGALLGMILGAVICGAILVIAVVSPSNKIKYYVKNSTFASFVIDRVMAPTIKPFSKKSYKKLTKEITSDIIKKIKSLPPPLR